MTRKYVKKPKEIKDSPIIDENDEKPTDLEQKKENKIKDDPRLPDKSLFRVDEVAEYFNVSASCIRLWIQHGHLKKEKVVGSIRISRQSILRCRFSKMAAGPQL